MLALFCCLRRVDSAWNPFFCPSCKKALVFDGVETKGFHCVNTECELTSFESLGSLPILVNPLCPNSLDLTSRLLLGPNLVERASKKSIFLNAIKQILQGRNNVSRSNFHKLLTLLPEGASVLIVGGATRGSGMEQVYNAAESGRIKLFSIDVYPAAEVHCVADAHCLPFPDSSFDCVIIQAVLEHVISPHGVVSEIHRVLSEKSIVYSEVPFIQSVHEGPFDFTRFTHSGHQLLFSRFCIISTGVHHGPTQSLLFIFSHYIQLVFGRISRHIVYTTFARISRFIDSNLFPNSRLVDIACGTYVLAQKRSDHVPPKCTVSLIKSIYSGQQ